MGASESDAFMESGIAFWKTDTITTNDDDDDERSSSSCMIMSTTK